MIFESGGSDNGISVLLNDTGFLVLGSSGAARTIEFTVPTLGLDFTDFVQVVLINRGDDDNVELAVRDVRGQLATGSGLGNATIGVNGATFFNHGSGVGSIGLSETNLGGLGGAATPAALTGFVGEIGLVNLYDVALEEEDVAIAFAAVATVSSAEPLAISAIVLDRMANTITLTWNATAGRFYDAQFSFDLADGGWIELEDAFEISTDGATRTFFIPPNQARLYFRIREVAAP